MSKKEIVVTAADQKTYVGYIDQENEFAKSGFKEGGWVVLLEAWELVTLRQQVADNRTRVLLGENRSYMLMPVGPFYGAVPNFRVKPETWYATADVEGCSEQLSQFRKAAEDAAVKSRAAASEILIPDAGMRGAVTNPSLREAMTRKT